MTGQRYGLLVVLGRAENGNNQCARWLCKCDCGTAAKIVYAQHLRSGRTTTCGCARSAKFVERLQAATRRHNEKRSKAHATPMFDFDIPDIERRMAAAREAIRRRSLEQ